MKVPSIVVVAATSLLTACGTATSAGTDSTVTIPSDRFLPVVSQSVIGGTVTFHNADADAHTVTSLPGAAVSFDLVIPSGGTRTLRLSSPGAYRYYCRFHAHYDAKTDQVAANPGADHPDEPMAGVIVAARSS
ncbi:MAG: cupredoxin domain-containing protein [Candidatus Dormibacteraeota bacterium]|nr:cupredoxin domain-containing protein [Candidatus Dormibacteraeota bacterium]